MKISDAPVSEERINAFRTAVAGKYGLDDHESSYLVYAGTISNKAYSITTDTIKIAYNTGEVRDLAEASDIFQIQNLSETKKKYFLCFPKDSGINY